MPTPHRHLRRKRWIAAGLLWLVVWFPLSLGPSQYGIRRGWLPVEVGLVYIPLWALLAPMPEATQENVMEEHVLPYLQWWDDLAERHAASN